MTRKPYISQSGAIQVKWHGIVKNKQANNKVSEPISYRQDKMAEGIAGTGPVIIVHCL